MSITRIWLASRPSFRGPTAVFTIAVWLGSLTLWSAESQAKTLKFPERSHEALDTSSFVARIAPMDLPTREREVRKQLLSGNVPEFLRTLCPVSVTNVIDGETNIATFYVTPDYLSVGRNQDYFLTPLSPNSAQQIADALNCSLPTRKMVNEIYAAADLKLAPTPIPPSAAMTTVPIFSNHNYVVRSERIAQTNLHPFGVLVAGHQKDVVLSARLAASPGKVAIYGWHQSNGAPIQPLYLGHTASWVDYSQGIRLVSNEILVNGKLTSLPKVLADPKLSALLSDEGPISNPRYPTNEIANLASGKPPAPSVASISWETGVFNERTTAFTIDPGVKVRINAPDAAKLSENVLLIFYALPNGNTTDQTIGRKLKPKDDWHFDIQHIGAQTRFLRELMPEKNIVVAYLESDLKSWPAWRKKNGDQSIAGILSAIGSLISTNNPEIVLSGHSGGGSLIFGYLNAVKSLPPEVKRIAFLDSNYAYDRELGHLEKLTAWLNSSDQHYLCVLAYNDAVALLNGKPFVSAAGGTWGRSHAMEKDLAETFSFTTRTNEDFERFKALDGRVQFILKENPEHKIFHTVQVERNGFIHAMVSGTANENKGYTYFGERAYSKWIANE